MSITQRLISTTELSEEFPSGITVRGKGNTASKGKLVGKNKTFLKGVYVGASWHLRQYYMFIAYS